MTKTIGKVEKKLSRTEVQAVLDRALVLIRPQLPAGREGEHLLAALRGLLSGPMPAWYTTKTQQPDSFTGIFTDLFEPFLDAHAQRGPYKGESGLEFLGRHGLDVESLAKFVERAVEKSIREVAIERDGISERLRQADSYAHSSSLLRIEGKLDGLVNSAEENSSDILASIRALDQNLLADYYRRLIQQYGRIDLETLTPPQYADELRVALNSIYVEQDIREEIPQIDLPKDLQQWIREEGIVDHGELPEAINSPEFERLRDAYKERPRKALFTFLADSASRRAVLLGDPGAGKSTLARYLSISLATSQLSENLTFLEGYVPLLIELKTYVGAVREGNCSTFLQFLDFLGQTEGLGLDEDSLHQYLASGGCALVIFDGLDEVFDPAIRDTVTRRIAAFADKYPSARIIVTSRIIGYVRRTLADAGFTHATLQDLSEQQIREFLELWYAIALHDRPNDAMLRTQRVFSAIEESRSIHQMAANPLLLTILAIIGRHQELPRERWKVYDYASTVLIEHWDVNRHLRDERISIEFIGEEDRRELLGRVAARMQLGGRGGVGGNYLTDAELRNEFEAYLQSRFRHTPAEAATVAKSMIRQFRERNFILSRYGSELYGFVHRAFLEFFCAESFRWKFERDQFITLAELKAEVYERYWNDPSWHEVLRLLAGMLRDHHSAAIITFLVDEVSFPWPWEFGSDLPRNVELAVRCLGEKRMTPQLDLAAERVITRVIQIIEHSYLMRNQYGSFFLQDEIVPFLGFLNGDWPGKDVYLKWYLRRGVRLAWSPISEISAKVAVQLFPGDHRLGRAFLASIHGTKDARLKLPLLEALSGFVAQIEVRVALLEWAGTGDSAAVRRAALEALRGGSLDPEVRALALERVAGDDNAVVRRVALEVLGGGSLDPEVRALALERAVGDDDEDVRRAALEVLGTGPLDPEVRALALERAAGDDNAVVRRAALEVLGTGPLDPEVRALALERAATDQDESVRMQAAITILSFEVDSPALDALEARGGVDRDWMMAMRAHAMSLSPEFVPDSLPDLGLESWWLRGGLTRREK
ncbi:NACHT domain-containing protein [Microbispora bryophytorum]|uniref:NACHT domain-containing protein n=1 Tax=Microbispora bryophytorum TaxID=1460882 RepID=UPI00168B2C09|nr:HEAT repeat domain-containing protein [Microbispora bryophytorum]MBD3135240.1 HEAT repeat domain-containing protein [Microbispora bryophytorum]